MSGREGGACRGQGGKKPLLVTYKDRQVCELWKQNEEIALWRRA